MALERKFSEIEMKEIGESLVLFHKNEMNQRELFDKHKVSREVMLRHFPNCFKNRHQIIAKHIKRTNGLSSSKKELIEIENKIADNLKIIRDLRTETNNKVEKHLKEILELKVKKNKILDYRKKLRKDDNLI